jgi:hypothetical protein
MGVAMGRPRNGRLSRVRVEFSLPPALADAVYTYADSADISLSQAGGELLKLALSQRGADRDEATGTASDPVVPVAKAGGAAPI